MTASPKDHPEISRRRILRGGLGALSIAALSSGPAFPGPIQLHGGAEPNRRPVRICGTAFLASGPARNGAAPDRV